MEWILSDALVEYPAALDFMAARVEAIATHQAEETVWLLEHPPLYTAGTSAKPGDLLQPDFPVHATGRGGQYTYHGPGQRVAYVMFDLGRRGRDLRAFVAGLEEVVIRTLGEFGIKGERRAGRVGVWVVGRDGAEEKIAAIGVRVRHWVSFHGLAINVTPELGHYQGIVPCGLPDYGVTSLAKLGVPASMARVDQALRTAFAGVFGGLSPNRD